MYEWNITSKKKKKKKNEKETRKTRIKLLTTYNKSFKLKLKFKKADI